MEILRLEQSSDILLWSKNFSDFQFIWSNFFKISSLFIRSYFMNTNAP